MLLSYSSLWPKAQNFGYSQLKRRLIEKALGAEVTDHLGYAKIDPAGRGTGNSRNGHSAKRLKSEDGELEIAVPRDRNTSFDPKIVRKGETRIDGFDAPPHVGSHRQPLPQQSHGPANSENKLDPSMLASFSSQHLDSDSRPPNNGSKHGGWTTTPLDRTRRSVI